ncbi:MAG: pilus assembly protein PilP [Gallionella sp.]
MKPIIYTLAVLMLAGCGGEEYQDLRDFVKNSGAGMRGKIEPPPEVKPYEHFAYSNNSNLPDPFKPRKPQKRASGGLNQPDLDRPKEELEEFPLENLKMVGYLFKNKVGYAVIRATDGKLRRAKAGNYIGLNFGLIKEVTDSEIIVKEMVQDSSGDWTERVSSLLLQE